MHTTWRGARRLAAIAVIGTLLLSACGDDDDDDDSDASPSSTDEQADEPDGTEGAVVLSRGRSRWSGPAADLRRQPEVLESSYLGG